MTPVDDRREMREQEADETAPPPIEAHLTIPARIAADRQILAECCIVLEDKTLGRTRERMLAWTVLRLLAGGHRDRPGWQEAWQ